MKKRRTSRMIAAGILSFCIVVMSSTSFLRGNAKGKLEDNPKELDSYFEELDSLEVVGDNDTLLTKDELSLLCQVKSRNCDYQFEGDSEILYNLILTNTKDYLQDKNEYKSILEIEDSSVREYVIKVIKDILRRVIESQERDDIHQLSTLKVVIGSLEEDTLGEFRSDENLIVIGLNNILRKSLSIDDVYMTIYDCLNHEFNHARQGSGEEKEIGTSFLMESSAESYNYNVLKSDYVPMNKNYSFGYSYLEERKYESKLFLLSLVDNSKDIESYYEAIYRGDKEAFFNFLNAKTRKDKEEILQGIWLADGVLLRNDYWMRVIKSNNLQDFGDRNITEILTNDAMGTFESIIFKRSIRGLIENNIQKRELSLEENLILYHFILLNILDTASYSAYNYVTCEASYTYYQEFLENYLEIEETFFNFLSTFYRVSLEEVKSKYTSLDKERLVNNINKVVSGKVIDKDFQVIGELIKKYPKMKIIMQGGIVLSNFNYNNLMDIKEKKNSREGIRLILK